MKKGEIYKGTVVRVDYPNKGRVRSEESEDLIQVKHVHPGQEISFRLKKKRRDRWEGDLQEVLRQGPGGQEPVCPHADGCGGCAWQGLSYEAQLALKESQVRTILDAAAEGADYGWEGIIPSPVQTDYRNKMEFTFGDAYKGGPLALGLHKRGAFHDIVTADGCRICAPDYGRVLRCTLDYFSEQGVPYYRRMRHTGYLRHLMVRRARAAGQMMICLVTASAQQLDADAERNNISQKEIILLTNWVKCLIDLESEGKLDGHIAGILHIRNDRLGDVIADEGTQILYGQNHLTEEILGLTFKISPFSFFQTNSDGAEVLYSKVREYLGETKGKHVYDLYSGTGTIAQILAPACEHVTGVEIVPEAVEAARDNAAINGLDNCDFLCGDVFEVLDGQLACGKAPDLIVLDPPREGVRPDALRKVMSYGAEKIVYVSCQITSLARDLPVLAAHGYVPEHTVSVDMFPYTTGIETVVCLDKNKPKDFHLFG